jgi:hypothetical protein
MCFRPGYIVSGKEGAWISSGTSFLPNLEAPGKIIILPDIPSLRVKGIKTIRPERPGQEQNKGELENAGNHGNGF